MPSGRDDSRLEGSRIFYEQAMPESLQFDQVVQARKELENLLTSSPKMETALRRLIRTVIRQARNDLAQDARRALYTYPRGDYEAFLPRDPRGTYRAVRSSVYKSLFGGQLNILNQRKRHAATAWAPQRTLQPGQRGGNRRKRGSKTRQIDSYDGIDRGFVLRWMNAGTTERNISFRPNPARARWKLGSQGGPVPATINTGRRGAISGAHWFETASKRELQKASEQLGKLIDDLIIRELRSGKTI